jgi:hypothetical protein
LTATIAEGGAAATIQAAATVVRERLTRPGSPPQATALQLPALTATAD